MMTLHTPTETREITHEELAVKLQKSKFTQGFFLKKEIQALPVKKRSSHEEAILKKRAKAERLLKKREALAKRYEKMDKKYWPSWFARIKQ